MKSISRSVHSLLISATVAWGVVSAGAREQGTNLAAGKQPGAGERSKPGTDKESAAAFVREHRNDIVFIKDKTGSGSGFIALMKGRKVLITNAHVMAALRMPVFELLDRSTLRLGAASVATGHDLVAFVVLGGGTGIPIESEVESEVKIGDPVVVLGNASGAGVVNTLEGEVLGIGPDRIEISAPFEKGNSGSPIVHLPSGKVIGVATYARLDTLLSGKEKVRRFGYRLDSAKTWQLIDWNRFRAESELAEKIVTATFELEDVLSGFAKESEPKPSQAYETPAIRTALDSYHNLVSRKSGNGGVAARELLAALREACKSDVAAAKNRFSYDYFRRQLEANESARAQLTQALDKALQP